MSALSFRPFFEELEVRLVPSSAPPTQFASVGAGGGGYYGAAAISPSNPNEFFIATDMGATYQTLDGGQQWTTLNPFASQIGGTYYEPVQFTNNPDVLYVNDNVPKKSVDGGVTWNTITDPIGDGNWISQLFADANNANNVVVSANNTIYLSTDGGNSFVTVAGPSGSGAPLTLTLPADNNQLYVAGLYSTATNDTLYLATNGGLLVGTPSGNGNNPYSWSLSSAGGLPSGTSIWSFSGATQGGTTQFYALLWSDANVSVSAHNFDGMSTYAGTYALTVGQGSWTALAAVPQQSPGQTDIPIYIAADPANPSIIYQGGTNSELGAPEVWKSTDGGQSWTQTIEWSNNGNIQTGILGASNDFPWYWGGSVSSMAVSATNPNDVLITTNFGAFSTSDGGAQWTSILQANPQPDGSAAAGVPYISSNNDTSNWFVNWANSSTMIAGYSDIGAEQSTDGGTSWAMASASNPFNVMYNSVTDPANGILYGAGGYYHDLFQQWNTGDVSGGGGGVYYSTDQGKSWNVLENFGVTATDVALDPNNPDTMYVTLVDTDTANPNNPNNPNFYSGMGGVWVTNDLQDGVNAHWYQLNQPTVAWGPAAGLAANHHTYTVNVSNNGDILVTFAREDSEVDQGGVFLGQVTWSGGVPTATWTDVTPNDGSATPDAARTWAMDLTIDPTDPTQQTWYVGSYILDHAEASSSRGLWQTTNGGQTWTLILGQTGSETYGPANPGKLGIFGGFIDPSTGGLYVGTDGDGLWYSPDPDSSSPTFEQVTAFPFSTVTRVSFNPYDSSQVWVSTFGDGLWVGMTVAGQPAAPTDLQASAGDGDVSLSWNAAAGATAYDIYRSTSSGAEGGSPYLSGITGTSFTDSGLSDGTTYFYEVTAVNSSGQSAVSNEASATPEAIVTVPAAPANLIASPGNSQVDLAWSASAGATSYNLYRGTSSGGEILVQTGITGTDYTDTGLSDGITYYYEVTAVNSAGESGVSNEASVTLTAATDTIGDPGFELPALGTGSSAYAYDPSGSPWSFSGSSPSGSGVAGNGSAFTSGNPNAPQGTQVAFLQETGTISQSVDFTAGTYVLSFQAAQRGNYQASNQTFQVLVDGTVVGTFTPAGTSYAEYSTDSFTVASGPHTIEFAGIDPNGGDNTVFLDEVSLTAVTALAPPTNLTASAGDSQVSLSWSASAGATSYNLYRGTSSGGETLVQTGITGTTFTDTALSDGTAYFYEVTAVNAGNEGLASNEVSATPEVAVPSAPTDLTSTAGNAQVSLSWSASAGASSYNLYRGTSSGGETLLQSGIAGTSFIDTSVSNGTTYFYEVTAVNAGGESLASNETSARPQLPVPPAPANLVATAGNTSVVLSWSSVAGSTSYDIYRGTSSGSETLLKSGVSATTFTDTHLTNGKTYYYEITAVNASGQSGRSAEVSATPNVLPAITKLSVSAGPLSGGTKITITGSGFSGVTAVYFGGVAATSFTVKSSGSIVAVAPAEGAGTVDVTVVTALGTSGRTAADQFTYLAAPTITALSPAQGSTAGGTTVIISGTGLDDVTKVTFGGVAAQFHLNANGTITVYAPAHAKGRVYVVVTSAGGTSAKTAADLFTYS